MAADDAADKQTIVHKRYNFFPAQLSPNFGWYFKHTDFWSVSDSESLACCPGISIFLKSPGVFDLQTGLRNYSPDSSYHNYNYLLSTHVSRAGVGQDEIRCKRSNNLMFYKEGPSRLGLKHMAAVSISCINSGIYPAGCQFGIHVEH